MTPKAMWHEVFLAECEMHVLSGDPLAVVVEGELFFFFYCRVSVWLLGIYDEDYLLTFVY
jgi:hypothetical protein